MHQLKKVTLASSLIISLAVMTSSNANHHDKLVNENSTVTFKQVMKGLLAETKMITEGIILEDFSIIESAASRIVKHPKPALSQRKKLMKNLASDIATFKGLDHVVHGGAEKIVQAAKNKKIDKVLAEYQRMITGCQSCHSQFKERLSKALQ